MAWPRPFLIDHWTAESWSLYAGYQSDTSTRGIENTVLCNNCCAEYGAISMGQGQEVHARRLVQQSTQDGSWVLLHNCHLGLDYMDELLDTIITGDSVLSSFRLWLTTEVHPQFPINFLQVSMHAALSVTVCNSLLHSRCRRNRRIQQY